MSDETGRNAISTPESLWKTSRGRSILRKIPFRITVDDISSVVGPVCPVFGVPWTPEGPYRPTLDRIIPEVGYVPGNIVVVSDLANRIKSDAPIHQIRQVLSFYERFFRGH